MRRVLPQSCAAMVIGVVLLLGHAIAGAQPARSPPTESASAKGGRLFRVAPPPDWVLPAVADYQAHVPLDDIDNGSFYVIFDRQARVQDGSDETYAHVAIRIATPAGVDGNSQIDLTVDPDWQKLTVHFVRVVRNGQVVDQLGRARVSELPQEGEREHQLYNGSWSVNMLLSDLRVGDVVEYAYTTQSRYPLFANHYWDRFTTTSPDPVHYQRMRVLVPSARALRFRLYAAVLQPRIRDLGGEREFTWEWRDRPAVHEESDTPAWHESWSSVELSDLPDWGAVARMEVPLYFLGPKPGAQLAAAIATVQAGAHTPAARLLSALKFVQNEIRYAGIEIGQGSHRPRSPGMVLQTRFGDCKDKTLLLIAMLRGLGIEATPVLVHTDDGPALAQRLPTPYAFNHVIVRARLGQSVYWLDATNSQQQGDLQSLVQPNFGWGLPIDPATQSLVEMPRRGSASSGHEVQLHIDCSAGTDKPASLTVQSRYIGDAADALRRELDEMSRRERDAQYLNYYSALFPGIRRTRDYDVSDDVTNDVLQITQHYVIDNAFTKTAAGVTLSLTADEMDPFIKLPATRIRSAPLAIEYPAHVTQEMTVKLPSGWQIKPMKTRVLNPAFRYTSAASFARDVLSLKYEYQALRDHVEASAAPAFYRDIERMNNAVGYELTSSVVNVAPVSKSAEPESTPGFALLLAFASGAGLTALSILLWNRSSVALRR